MSEITPESEVVINRPKLHFTPQQGWINDPNGLVYFDGEYHLFYQYYPDDLKWGPMHWGHAVSTDLSNWEELPVALSPDDDGMCFSGSAIVDSENLSGLFDDQPGLLAFYTAHRILSDDPDDYIQEQHLAFSRDRGRSWEKYPGNPVISSPGFKDFRDPKVIWHEPSQRWIMALACGQSIRFYHSENLIDWQLGSEFGETQGAHTEGPWECPDLFELPVMDGNSRWVLIVGVGAHGEHDKKGSFTQYFIGNFDGEVFYNDNPAEQVLLLDEGRDFYATQSWFGIPDSEHRKLAVSWMSNWLYANHTPEMGWRGSMTYPRELTLRNTPVGLRLCQAFARELFNKHDTAVNPVSESIALSNGENYQDSTFSNQPHYTKMALEMSQVSRVQLFLQQSEYPELELSMLDSTLSVRHLREGNNNDATFNRHFPHDISLQTITDKSINIEWISDYGSLEILINNGQQSLTSLTLNTEILYSPNIKSIEGKININLINKFNI